LLDTREMNSGDASLINSVRQVTVRLGSKTRDLLATQLQFINLFVSVCVAIMLTYSTLPTGPSGTAEGGPCASPDPKEGRHGRLDQTANPQGQAFVHVLWSVCHNAPSSIPCHLANGINIQPLHNVSPPPSQPHQSLCSDRVLFRKGERSMVTHGGRREKLPTKEQFASFGHCFLGTEFPPHLPPQQCSTPSPHSLLLKWI